MNSPKEIANNYIAIGKGKVNTPVAKMFVLGILAGIFIAFGGVASTAAAVSIPLASVGKFLGACIFPGGLWYSSPEVNCSQVIVFWLFRSAKKRSLLAEC